MLVVDLAVVGCAYLLVIIRVLLLETPRNTSYRFDYQHKSVIEDIRTSNRQLPVGPTSVITKGAYTRPNLPHWVLSKLPTGISRRLYRRFGIVAELMFVSVLLWLGLSANRLTLEALGVALMAFVLTPQFVRSDRPGNPGFDLTSIGLALSAVGISSMVPWLIDGNPVWLLLGTVATATIVLTDRIALQLHGLSMLAVATVEPLSVVVLFGGLALSIVISKGRALRLFAAHFIYIIDGIRRLPYTEAGSGWSRFERQIGEQALRSQLGSVTTLVGFNPFVVTGLVVALAEGLGFVPLTNVDAVLMMWLAGAVVGFAVTSIPPFDIAGPSDAYLLGGVIPAAVLTGVGVMTFGTGYTLFVGIAILIGAIFTVLARRRETSDESDETWTRLLEELDEFEPSVILLHPSERSTELAYETNHRVADVLQNQESSTEDLNVLFPDTHLEISDRTNILKNIMYYFNPDLVIFDKERADLPDAVPSSATPIYENDRYQLFEFDDVVEESF